MTTTFMIIPANDNVELTKVSLALVKAMEAQHIKVAFLQLVDQIRNHKKKIPDSIDRTKPIDVRYVERLLSRGEHNELLENIVAMHEKTAKTADVLIVKGLTCMSDQLFVPQLNVEISNALDAKVIILAAADKKKLIRVEDQIKITARNFSIYPGENIVGCIINRIDTPADFISTRIQHITNIPCRRRPKLRQNSIVNYMAKHIDTSWIKHITSTPYKKHLSPSKFRNQLIERAQAANKTIVLPEATDIRIIKAAQICARRKIARCILIGKPKEIHAIAQNNGVKLSSNIEIINSKHVINGYIEPIVNIRRHKGMTNEIAAEYLQDNVVLATMMLQQGKVDGAVSGAIHTTANTIRPAFQLIKTKPGTNLVSSLFFMCLHDQVLVYADCAINPNPTAEELADIAIQSSDSAKTFGIEPKVAMISYSTGVSGHGPDVELVRTATKIAEQKRPDIIIDGPLQYDAALVEDIARKKAPESPIAGEATVCIFPNLTCGNAIYKAVQRSTNTISIGPMLQGLKKPVNDLSRGCLIEDVVFTIALTAIQATQN